MKENSTHFESFSLHVRLRSLNTSEYYDLVSSLLSKKPELNQLVLEWFKEKKESINDFPKEIIEYYWQKAYINIPNGSRKTYWTAAKYLKKVKGIYFDVLDNEAGWKKRFSDLKSEFKKTPAFLEEVSNL